MSFASQYQQLNTAQKLAVDTIDGPVMVIAGPGTGKTHILTLRIANILQKTDANPSNILALTFTDSAARTMRSRLYDLIGTPAYSVRIETFHALADRLIREYPEFFPFNRDATPLTSLEQFTIVHSLLENPQLKHLRTPGSPYHYTKDIIGAISTLKRENIGPQKFFDIVADETSWFENEKSDMKKTELLKWESTLGKHRELAQMYVDYQESIQKKSHYDFDDMLLTTRQALESHPLLLAALQEQFQYILVDEYQDTNGVQNSIVDLIASFWGERANLFVVGDPNQTIFRFQGAILANTLDFLDRYPSATIITLTTGYRSSQTIYTSAHQLLSPILTMLADHPLTASLTQTLDATHQRGTFTFTTLPTDTDELLFLVTHVQALIAQGIHPSEIAILFKRNSEGEQLANLFARADIPFHVEKENNVLADPLLHQFFTLLSLLAALKNGSEHRLLFDTIGFDWFSLHLESLPLLQLMRSFAQQKTVLTPFEFISGKTLELNAITEKLSDWVHQESKLTFPEFIQLVLHDSGFLAYLEHHREHGTTLQNVITLLREVETLARSNHAYRLTDFLEYIDTMNSEHLTLARQHETTSDSVTLSTVHKAKGREWSHVFLPFFREGYWGNARNKSGITLPQGIVAHAQDSDPDHDERRLLFVALTRAKESIHVSTSAQTQRNDRVSETLPSPYSSELSLMSSADFVEHDTTLSNLFLTPPSTRLFDSNTRDWLTTLVANLSLSASSLNAYLEDPKVFFERYILKLTEATKPHLAYGTAIHSALEFHYRQYTLHDHTHPALGNVLSIFDHALSTQILTDNDLQIRSSQGHATLQAYLDTERGYFPDIQSLEESFGWKRGKIVLGDIQLTGKIDRIDIVDRETRTLRVIDYKTGKPKTLGDIEGTTQAADLTPRELALPEGIRGRMKRQLLFYKLLLSLDPFYKNFKVDEGIFEFVEPQKGSFVRRMVKLTNQDVDALKVLIREVMTEIRSLKFLESL